MKEKKGRERHGMRVKEMEDYEEARRGRERGKEGKV